MLSETMVSDLEIGTFQNPTPQPPMSIDINKRTQKEIVTNQLAASKAKVFLIYAFYAMYSN